MRKILFSLEHFLLLLVSLLILVSPYSRWYSKHILEISCVCFILVLLIKYKGRFWECFQRNNFLTLPIALFGVVCAATMLLSLSPYHSQKIFINRFLLYLLAFWMGSFLGAGSKKNILFLTAVFLFSAGTLAIGGIRDYVLYRPQRLFTIFGARLPFNMLPLFITYFVSFSFSFVLFAHSRILKIASGVVFIVLLPSFVWQDARAAWVSVCAVIVLASSLKGFKHFKAALLVLVLVSCMALFSNNVRQRIKTIPFPSQWNYRTPLYSTAFKMFQDHPVVGVGLGMYEKMIKTDKYDLPADYPNSDHSLYLHPHNVYLEILAEMGLLGFAAFLNFFAVYFIGIFKGLRAIRDLDLKAAVIASAMLVVSALIFGISGSIITVGVNETYIFWIFVGLSVGVFIPKTKGEVNG